MHDRDRWFCCWPARYRGCQSPTSAKAALRSVLAKEGDRLTDHLRDAVKLAQNLTRNRARTEVHLLATVPRRTWRSSSYRIST
ncbi:MAG: hypothetical protein Ct9H300mP32_5160 [Verrucomicrobiota bacterium]|nr:MAG: hypothetical protein Ct9H300mP32_5160 [Verrucomicrobiota bacterium]